MNEVYLSSCQQQQPLCFLPFSMMVLSVIFNSSANVIRSIREFSLTRHNHANVNEMERERENQM